MWVLLNVPHNDASLNGIDWKNDVLVACNWGVKAECNRGKWKCCRLTERERERESKGYEDFKWPTSPVRGDVYCEKSGT